MKHRSIIDLFERPIVESVAFGVLGVVCAGTILYSMSSVIDPKASWDEIVAAWSTRAPIAAESQAAVRVHAATVGRGAVATEAAPVVANVTAQSEADDVQPAVVEAAPRKLSPCATVARQRNACRVPQI